MFQAIVQPTDASGEAEKHVILTVQPRLAVSSLAFTEIPAGMLDDSGSFTGTAAQELKEEAHLHVKIAELLDLSELALEQGQADSLTPTGQLRTAMYPSPGKTYFIPSPRKVNLTIVFFSLQRRMRRVHETLPVPEASVTCAHGVAQGQGDRTGE